MRNPSPISTALTAHLFLLTPLISHSHSATTTTQVQNGDSLFQIAQAHGVTVQSLEAANPGVDALSLYVGQTINVPVADDVPAMSDMVTGSIVFASSKAVSPTASVVASDDVPAVNDMVTGSIVFVSSGSQTSAATTALFQPTSEDIPAQSDFVTGSIVFASGAQTAKGATPTTLVTSSR